MTVVHRRPGPVDPVRGVQLGEQDPVQLVKTPASVQRCSRRQQVVRSEAEIHWQFRPRRFADEQDVLKTRRVRNRP